MAAKKSTTTTTKTPKATKSATQKGGAQESSRQEPVAKTSKPPQTTPAQNLEQKNKRAVKKPEVAVKAPAKTSSQKKIVKEKSPDERYLATQEEAYYIAERANWELDPATCWAEAEKETAKSF